MKLFIEIQINILKVFILVTLLQFSLGASEDIEGNVREKRTIGVLFRTFVDAFQTQRQPPPMVHSYQPPRQTRPQAQTQQPQSSKVDLLSSSKNIFQQKNNLLKPSSTQAPTTETTTSTMTPPDDVTQTPNAAPQVSSPNEANQSEALPPSSPTTADLNPYQNLFTPSEHHPLSPFKAQFLIMPFQGQHGSGATFPGFGIEPQLPSMASVPPLNYQAELYFHPPQGGGQPSVNQYPSNGWHDANEVLSRGIQSNYGNDHQGDGHVIKLTKPKEPTLNTYNSYEGVGTSHHENPTQAVNPLHSNYENDIESRRVNNNQNYFKDQRQYLEQPLLFPNFQHDGLVNSENFNHNQGENLLVPFLGHGFNYPAEEAYRSQTPENNKKTDPKDQSVQSSNSKPLPKQVKNVNSIPPHRNIDNAHDYLPQREGYQKYPENSRTHSQDNNKENQIHYSEGQPFYQNHGDGYNIQHDQHSTKVGRLPDSLQYQYHLMSLGPLFPESQDTQEMASPYFGGQHYYKRSNRDEKHSSNNCSSCSKNK